MKSAYRAANAAAASPVENIRTRQRSIAINSARRSAPGSRTR